MKYYTEEHEWLAPAGSGMTWRIGITDFAQEQLGDVVNIELPEVGASINAGDASAVVESVKSASDVNAPVSGTVTARNNKVLEDPALLNESAEDKGWLFEIKLAGELDASSFMDAAGYAKKFPA